MRTAILALFVAAFALVSSLQAGNDKAPAGKTATCSSSTNSCCAAACSSKSACSKGAPSKKAFLSPRAAEHAK